MNFEESRLRTFKNWPSNAPVDPRRIAKAGFYYMGLNLEVQCFSCGGRISEWNYNDKVMTRHRSLDPRCPFVLSPALSGNVPVASEGHVIRPLNQRDSRDRAHFLPETVSSQQDNEDLNMNQQVTGSSSLEGNSQMQDESARLHTFTNWPVSFIVAPKSLAAAGFYYVQQGDKVRCFYCSVIIGRWEAGDNPMLEHQRHSPDCRFVRRMESCSSLTNEDGSSSSGINFRPSAGDHSDGAMKSLGVQIHRVAKHPKFSNKDSRLATYTLWPKHISQTPEDLAEAGFYYTGGDDQVRCFHCDGGLRKWEPNDDPWVEHARWFPNCGFIVHVKGEQFIDDSIQQHPPIVPEEHTHSSFKVSKSRTCFENLALSASQQLHQVSEEELEVLMNSSTAIAALQIGLDFSRVKMAIRQKLEQTGIPFSTPDDLIEASLDIQLEEIPFQDIEETWSTPLHSPERLRQVNAKISRPLQNQTMSHEETDSSDSENAEVLSVGSSKLHIEEKNSETTTCQYNNHDNSDSKVTLEEENRRLREARLCKICMDNEVCIVFLPCGHLVTCVNCAHSLFACPVCRQTIKATVRTFLS